MSDSVRPHRRQPTRPRRPWDSPLHFSKTFLYVKYIYRERENFLKLSFCLSFLISARFLKKEALESLVFSLLSVKTDPDLTCTFLWIHKMFLWQNFSAHRQRPSCHPRISQTSAGSATAIWDSEVSGPKESCFSGNWVDLNNAVAIRAQTKAMGCFSLEQSLSTKNHLYQEKVFY